MPAVESGINALRALFVREATIGETPTDPDWLRFSDSVMSLNFDPNGNIYSRRPIGTPDVAGFHPGPEDHSFTIEYHLQRWIDAATKDASYDGLMRDASGALPDTHSCLFRQSLANRGVDSNGRRIYTVVQGARVQMVTIPGNPDSGEPIRISLDYVAELVRSYVIDQPAAGGTVTVRSSSVNDTTQSVTIEDDGVANNETLALNGTSDVSGATSFSSIDAVWLDAETEGDIEIEIGGSVLMTILGSNSYNDAPGDRGIPLLGSGSMESALGTDYEHIFADVIQRGGAALADNVLGIELTVTNNLETTPRLSTRRRAITEGSRDIEITATVFGEKQSHDALIEHLKTAVGDFTWQLAGGTLTASDAVLMTPGGRMYESGQAVMRRDNTFVAKDITLA